MISSRNLEDLLPQVHAKAATLINACAAAGIKITISCTYRDFQEQNRLYQLGRSVPGLNVRPGHPMGNPATNAIGGHSWHNWRRAFDIVLYRNGKAVWGTDGDGLDDNPADDSTDDLELWQRVGKIGRSIGLEWAGNWRNFREFPHFQLTEGLTLASFLASHPRGLT